MIIWNIILTVLLLASLGFSIYSFILSRRNMKANLEVLSPMWEKHEKILLKLLKNK